MYQLYGSSQIWKFDLYSQQWIHFNTRIMLRFLLLFNSKFMKNIEKNMMKLLIAKIILWFCDFVISSKFFTNQIFFFELYSCFRTTFLRSWILLSIVVMAGLVSVLSLPKLVFSRFLCFISVWAPFFEKFYTTFIPLKIINRS